MPKAIDPAVLLKDLLDQALEVADDLADHTAAAMIAQIISHLERSGAVVV